MTAPTLTVHKYQLAPSEGVVDVEMPVSAVIVHTHEQGGFPVIWAEVNTSAPMVRRRFVVLATGESIPMGVAANYVGTVHITWTVWHVYEVTR